MQTKQSKILMFQPDASSGPLRYNTREWDHHNLIFTIAYTQINVCNWVYAILKLRAWLSMQTCVVSDTLKRAKEFGQNIDSFCSLFCIVFLVL